ncbi:MAG: FeS-binding protein [Chloroflexi bacterium]|nr:NIL domain-containing protein [Chloroflexota bacterium]MDE2702699.1 NIL domain-containing protein [Chloroflexota bacterium]MDE2937287.1 NIL domain-containing protein [Chloroflexota bacterium]MXW29081.1 FeS-binding protein [Chloroflexota bacterium]MXX66380.1 FeS-binding protein [Chloroflexota bacterium]
MASVRLKLTFPEELITEPIVYLVSRDFELVSNIRRADVREHIGWMVLSLEGDEDNIDAGIAWMQSRGVIVDPVEGDIVQ